MMRIGFCGIPGSGKTSTSRGVAAFCRRIDKLNNIELVPEYARRRIAKYGPIDDINHQFRILKKQLEWEDSVGNVDLVITDAPLFMGFMYATSIQNNDEKTDPIFYNDLFKEMVKLNSPNRYDIMFHIPPKVKPVADGVRSAIQFDDEWREDNDNFLRVIMKDIFPSKKFIIVEPIDLQERINFCINQIEQYIKEF